MTLFPSTLRLFLFLAVAFDATTAFAPLTTTKTYSAVSFGLRMRSDESEFRGDCHDFDYEGSNMPGTHQPMPFGHNDDNHHQDQDAPFFDQPPPFGHERMPHTFGHPNNDYPPQNMQQQDDFFMSTGPSMREANPDDDYEQFLHQQHMELQEFFDREQQEMPQQMMREIPMPPPLQQQQQQEMYQHGQEHGHPNSNSQQQQPQGEVNIQALVADATAILKADHRVLEVLGPNFHLLQDCYVAHQEGVGVVFDVRFVMERKGAFVSGTGGTVHVVTDPTGIVRVLLQPDQNSGAPLEVHLGQQQQQERQDGDRHPQQHQQHPQGHAAAGGGANSQQSSSGKDTVIDVEILEELKELKKKYPEM